MDKPPRPPELVKAGFFPPSVLIGQCFVKTFIIVVNGKSGKLILISEEEYRLFIHPWAYSFVALGKALYVSEPVS